MIKRSFQKTNGFSRNALKNAIRKGRVQDITEPNLSIYVISIKYSDQYHKCH